MIVTVSGEIGAGKSTVARQLARALGLRYLSAGDAMRAEAQRRGVSLAEMGRLAEEDHTIDRALDAMQVDAAKAGDVLLESRLSGRLVDGDLRIWLRAPLEVRARRIAARDGLAPENALREVQAREASERRRYLAIYRLDPADLSRYHVVVDTSLWSAEAVADALASLARLVEAQRVSSGTASGGPPGAGRRE